LIIQIIPNQVPVFNGVIPDQTWDQDTNLDNVIDLKNYFTDDGKIEPLSYSFTGNSNIGVTLSNGVVSFSQPAGWFGVETIYFSALDGEQTTQSDPVKLTVVQVGINQTPTNNPPVISSIPDQSKDVDVDFGTFSWTFSLNSYVSDDEDSVSILNWTIEGEDSDIVKVSIDSSNEAKFEPIIVGVSTITFIVTDSGGLSDEQDVKITINSGEEEEEESVVEEVGELEILSYTPNNDPAIEIGEEIAFFISN